MYSGPGEQCACSAACPPTTLHPSSVRVGGWATAQAGQAQLAAPHRQAPPGHAAAAAPGARVPAQLTPGPASQPAAPWARPEALWMSLPGPPSQACPAQSAAGARAPSPPSPAGGRWGFPVSRPRWLSGGPACILDRFAAPRSAKGGPAEPAGEAGQSGLRPGCKRLQEVGGDPWRRQRAHSRS